VLVEVVDVEVEPVVEVDVLVEVVEVDVLVEVVEVDVLVVDDVVVDCVLVVVGVVVLVVVVDVVPPVGQRLASWLCGPGVDGPRRMSPSCLL